MMDDQDRAELKEIWASLKESVDDCLENHNILPASITHNGGKAGMTIELRKLYPQDDPED